MATAAMEQMDALHQLVKVLGDENCIVTSESPAIAADKAERYDNRLKLYKCAIFSLLAQYEIATHIQSCETYEELVDQQKLDEETRAIVEALSQDGGPDDAELESTSLLSQTMETLKELPDKWKQLNDRREALLLEAKAAIEAHSEKATSVEESEDWSSVAKMMKEQREMIQAAIDELDAEAASIHANEIAKEVRKIDEGVEELKAANNESRQIDREIVMWEAVLGEAHGIAAYEEDDLERTPEGGIDPTRYLSEEIAFVSEHYLSQASASKDIFSIKLTGRSGDEIEMTISPRKEWLRELRKGDNVPILKFVSVTYRRDSIYPSDIKVKVDLSEVPSPEAVQQSLATQIDEWKYKAAKTPQLDLHALLSIFVTFDEKTDQSW